MFDPNSFQVQGTFIFFLGVYSAPTVDSSSVDPIFRSKMHKHSMKWSCGFSRREIKCMTTSRTTLWDNSRRKNSCPINFIFPRIRSFCFINCSASPELGSAMAGSSVGKCSNSVWQRFRRNRVKFWGGHREPVVENGDISCEESYRDRSTSRNRDARTRLSQRPNRPRWPAALHSRSLRWPIAPSVFQISPGSFYWEYSLLGGEGLRWDHFPPTPQCGTRSPFCAK